jgi:hypothetical protein
MPYKMRKIRGQDLYKVINTETGEEKSKGSTKEDAKKQLRLLKGLERKELKGGKLKASQIKDVIDLSYNKEKKDAPKGYEIDPELSNGRVKVYKDLNSDQVIVAHRGSRGMKDWLDNVRYGLTGNIKNTETYKKHEAKHQKALDKYGADNVIAVGHSRAGKYVEELNKDTPVKEVITYNKASGVSDLFRKNPSNQTDIRTGIDVVSALAPIQRSYNKVITIPSKTFNPLIAHGTNALGALGDKLFGKGFKPSSMRVGDMRKFIKLYKKSKGEKMTGGSRLGKKELVDMMSDLRNDDDFDEMVGGSIWTDFIKDFSAKHSLKYACALSKYKEPLKKAYKLFKEKKEWFEPMKMDSGDITDAPKAEEPKETPNIQMKIEEVVKPSQPSQVSLPPLQSERELLLLTYKIAELKDILAGYKVKGVSKMKKDDMIKAILQQEGIKEGVKWGSKNWLLQDLKDATRCNDPTDITGVKSLRFTLAKNEEKLKKEMDKTPKDRQQITLIKNNIERLKNEVKKCEMLLSRDLEKEFEGSGLMGGSIWTDFVKDYAKKMNTTYGCALSDVAIKPAYRLFKDGKEWFFPKVSKEIETQTDDEFVEPEPAPAPQNIEPEINEIEKKIEELKAVGEAKGAVSYNPSVLITDIAFINLLEKYGAKCIVSNVNVSSRDKLYSIEVGIDIKNAKTWSFPQFFADNLGRILKDCVDRGVQIIAIPLSLKFGSSNSGHANMLIYRPFKRVVERFEPHGQFYGNSVADDKIFNDHLRELFEVKMKPVLGDIRYREPREICPFPKGFQSLESSLKGLAREGGGFCSMWSFFLAEMVFLNPDKSTKEVIEEVFKITKEDPSYLKSVIRGYVIEIEKTLDELLKKVKAPGFRFGGKDAYRQVRDNESALLAWLTQLIFDTGKYSDAPPQFEPLPDVEVVKKDEKEKLIETYQDKIKSLSVKQLNNIYGLYGLRGHTGKKEDIINRLVRSLEEDRLAKFGATGLGDLDVILEEELYKNSNRLPRDYFIKKRDERQALSGGKKPNIGKAFKNFGKSVDKAFKPVGKAFDTATQGLAQGAIYANPMMWALKDKTTSKLMGDLGEVTNDYLLPAVVSAGKPIYDATAMGASTLLTGNPILGKALADSLWDNMVAKPGYDPRERQKSELLGEVSEIVGKTLAKPIGSAISGVPPTPEKVGKGRFTRDKIRF